MVVTVILFIVTFICVIKGLIKAASTYKDEDPSKAEKAKNFFTAAYMLFLAASIFLVLSLTGVI